MDLSSISNKLGRISALLAYVGAASLFAMTVLTTADVVGRYFFNSPITGALEVTEFMVLILIFSFLAYTQSQKTHVSVDLLVAIFPEKIKKYIKIFNHLVCLGLMSLITWMGYQRALELLEHGEASPNLGVSHYPFVFFLVFGCLVMCIEYMRNLIELLGSGKGDGEA
ncbi:TRAP transporter small permease [Thermodesulfobacteriota bacterium]